MSNRRALIGALVLCASVPPVGCSRLVPKHREPTRSHEGNAVPTVFTTEVVSLPPGAWIEVDGTRVGRAPVTLEWSGPAYRGGVFRDRGHTIAAFASEAGQKTVVRGFPAGAREGGEPLPIPKRIVFEMGLPPEPPSDAPRDDPPEDLLLARETPADERKSAAQEHSKPEPTRIESSERLPDALVVAAGGLALASRPEGGRDSGVSEPRSLAATASAPLPVTAPEPVTVTVASPVTVTAPLPVPVRRAGSAVVAGGGGAPTAQPISSSRPPGRAAARWLTPPARLVAGVNPPPSPSPGTYATAAFALGVGLFVFSLAASGLAATARAVRAARVARAKGGSSAPDREPPQSDARCKRHIRIHTRHVYALHCAVLGLPPDVPFRTVERRYKELALRYHPDKNGSRGAAGTFNRIARSYEALAKLERTMPAGRS